MIRNIAGVVLGIVLGSIANMLLINLNMVLFPLPEGIDPKDQAAFKAHFSTLPPSAYLLPFLAHFSQVFVGGLVATKIGSASPTVLVGIIGVLTMAGSVATNLMLQVPAWTWIELPLYLPVIWGTILLARRLRRAPDATPTR